MWFNSGIFFFSHIAPAYWALQRYCIGLNVLLKFHWGSTMDMLCLSGLILICNWKCFKSNNANNNWTFFMLCLIWLHRAVKDSLKMSHPISLREHHEAHCSASLGDLINFDTEMIWQHSKGMFLRNFPSFSQSETALFFFVLRLLTQCCSVSTSLSEDCEISFWIWLIQDVNDGGKAQIWRTPRKELQLVHYCPSLALSNSST